MKRLRFIGAVAAVAAFTAQSAWANEGGLPQFDTTLFPEQLFWLVISFGVLYVLMSRVALPRVVTTKENRKHIISTEIEAAEAASDSAKAAVIAVEKALAAARARAHEHVNGMMVELAAEMLTHQTAQERELKRRLHAAEADIAVTREAALKKVRDSAADLAAAIVSSITGSKTGRQA